MASSPAFYYVPGEYDPRRRLMGRQVASQSFLKAVARYEPADQLLVYCPKAEDVRPFVDVFRAAAPTGAGQPARRFGWVRRGDLRGLARVGLLYRPDPVLHDEAWLRLHGSPRDFSLCGVTHTLSSSGPLHAMAQYLTAPFEEWDAVICTSGAVLRVVTGVLEEHAALLAERLGAPVPPRPRLQLPVIPLGVHVDDFDTTTPAMRDARVRWRQKLGIAEGDLCVLFVGRISFHAKANPHPMYRALELAAHRTGRTLHLVQKGPAGTPQIARTFARSARELCPSVRCHMLTDGAPDLCTEVWAAADLFTSLSDNVQETFGLTPVEAMAAGLPAVVSDWDGYRETVRDGVDGFLVPTTLAPPGSGEDLAARHATGLDTYDRYLAATTLSVAVDAERAAAAFEALIVNPDLRLRMAASGRERARAVFDWRQVYGRYRELWAELAARRTAAAAVACPRPAGRSANPRQPDPFRTFAHYGTFTVDGATRLRAVGARTPADWRRELSQPLMATGREHMVPPAELAAFHALVGRPAGCTVDELAAASPRGRGQAVPRTVVWLVKAGLVTLEGAPAVAARPGPLEGASVEGVRAVVPGASEQRRSPRLTIARCRHGTLVWPTSYTTIGRSLGLYGEFGEGDVVLLERFVRPGDVVVDVGANIGTTVLPLARAVGASGEVLAFEPQPLMAQCLQAALTLNECFNVRVVTGAVGAEAGWAHMEAPGVDAGGNYAAMGLGARGVQVPLFRLDDLELTSCALLKIDVEGHEWPVLQGARQLMVRHRPVVYLEAKRIPGTVSCLRWLLENGWRCFWHFTRYFRADNFRRNRHNVHGLGGDMNVLAVPASSARVACLPVLPELASPEEDWQPVYHRFFKSRGLPLP